MIFSVSFNVLLGIVGGIISSIIVSRVFLIVEEYKAEIHRIEELMYKLGYFAGVLSGHKDSLSIIYNEKKDFKLRKLSKNILPDIKEKVSDTKKLIFGMQFNDRNLYKIFQSIQKFVEELESVKEIKIEELTKMEKKANRINHNYMLIIKKYKKNILCKILIDPIVFGMSCLVIGLSIFTVSAYFFGL